MIALGIKNSDVIQAMGVIVMLTLAKSCEAQLASLALLQPRKRCHLLLSEPKTTLALGTH